MNLEPGDVLQQAMIGAPVAGLVDLLIGTSPVLWRPDDPAGLTELVGVGTIARTLREERRFREIVMVTPDRSTILVLPRMTSIDDAHELREFTGAVVEAEDVWEHVRSDEVWNEFGRWLTRVFVTASTRPECIVVEMNTPEFSDEPYALAIVTTDNDPPMIHLECNPRPDGAVMWPPGDVPEGQTISTPLNRERLGIAGLILVEAIRTWSESVYDVAIRFCSVDQRPVALDTL